VRVLQVISSVDPSGGGPIEGVNQLSAILASAGHSIEIASLDPPDAPFLNHGALPVYPLGPTANGYGFSAKLIPWLRANRARYDAVVVNGLWQFQSFGTWYALRKSDTPYVVYPHGMLDPWFKRRYPLKHLKKWLYWPWAEYRVLRDAQAVLFTSEQERLLARLSFWLYRCNEVVVGLGTSVPLGNPALEVHSFYERYPELQGQKFALFMGRIHPKKGCDLLIDAFAQVLARDPQWRLVIAGPDQVGWQAPLNHRAVHAGIATRITWTGMIRGAMKWGALRAAEAFVLPSHQENFGIAVAEALAVGLPVLISDKVNIWREVQADGAGFVEEDTLEGTSKLLQSYIDTPEAKIHAMRQRARACFERHFEIKKAAQNLEAMLSRLKTPLSAVPRPGAAISTAAGKLS
jgi:glycosyltransferase involved in cell wall biosynthesis